MKPASAQQSQESRSTTRWNTLVIDHNNLLKLNIDGPIVHL